MAVGIICEYDPMHMGHVYQMAQAKALTKTSGTAAKDDRVILVMSGCFVERGEAAFLDPYLRTRMALSAGADLVISLPTYYAASTAEWFAYGAVKLLYATGLTDSLSFGIEDPSCLPVLEAFASAMTNEKERFDTLLKKALESEPSFATAREKVLTSMVGAPLPKNPNAILALEYLKALRSFHDWQPGILPVKREGMGYHETLTKDYQPESKYVSATYLRNLAKQGKSILPYIPQEARPLLEEVLAKEEYPYVFPEDLFPALQYRLTQHTPESLQGIDEISEGLENRILRVFSTSGSYQELLDALKTKRYATARLKRILLNVVLDISKERKEALSFREGPAYIQVMGVKKESLSLLSDLRQNAKLPVIINLAKDMSKLEEGSKAYAMLQDELRFNRYYQTLSPTYPVNQLSQGLIIV